MVSTQNPEEAIRGGLSIHAVFPAIYFALLTSTLELFAAYRDSKWSGGSFEHWFNAFGIFLVLVLVNVLALRISRIKTPKSAALLFAALHGVYWLALLITQGSLVGQEGIFAFGALAVSITLAFFATRKSPESAWAERGIAVLVSFLLALALVADIYYFEPDARPDVLLRYPALWAVLVIGFALVQAWSRGTPKRIGLAGLALATIAPGLALGVTEIKRSGSQPGAGPHVVLITIDTFRPDVCSFEGGSVPTPNLDKVAEQSALFTQAYSVAPWTFPGFVGLFASRYSPNLRPDADSVRKQLMMSFFPVHSGVETLAEKMAADGYRTVGVSTNPWLNRSAKGLLRGFEHVLFFPDGVDVERWGPLGLVPNLQQSLRAWLPTVFMEKPEKSSTHGLRYVAEYLRRSSDEKIFLWFHLMDPHSPFDPPARYRSRTGPWPFFAPDHEYFKMPFRENPNMVHLSPDQREYVRSLYAGELMYTDELVGDILQLSDAYGLRDDGYLVVSSDHGEELWEHERLFHGQALYNEHTRAILTFAGPGIQPSSVPTPVSTIDLTPTLTDLLGIEPDSAWMGRSLAGALRGEAAMESIPIFFNSTHMTADEPQMGARKDAAKIIYYMQSDRHEYYDLSLDPLEQLPSPQPPNAEAVDLTSYLEKMFTEHISTLPRIQEDLPLNEESRDALEALGYL